MELSRDSLCIIPGSPYILFGQAALSVKVLANWQFDRSSYACYFDLALEGVDATED